jgi:hypothetical protein
MPATRRSVGVNRIYVLLRGDLDIGTCEFAIGGEIDL